MKNQFLSVLVFLSLALISCTKQPIPKGEATPYTADQAPLKADDVVLYIDLDGELLSSNYGFPIQSLYCAPVILPKGVTDQILALVSSNLAAYKVVVTTNYSLFLSRPKEYRQRVILTPNLDTLSKDRGGTAFRNSFTEANDIPCFVFLDQVYGITRLAITISHEVGHAFGLNHPSPDDMEGIESMTEGRIMDTAHVERPVYIWSAKEKSRLTQVLGNKEEM